METNATISANGKTAYIKADSFYAFRYAIGNMKEQLRELQSQIEKLENFAFRFEVAHAENVKIKNAENNTCSLSDKEISVLIKAVKKLENSRDSV